MRNIHIPLLIILSFFIGLQACEKKQDAGPDIDPGKERTVSLSQQIYTFNEGENFTLKPQFGSFDSPKRKYSWEFQDEGIVSTVSVDNSDYSLTMLGLKPGSTIVTITSEDKSLHTSALINVEAAPGLKGFPVFVGFGSETRPAGWNVFLSNGALDAGSIISNLVDQNDEPTGFSIEIVEGFNDQNTSGPQSLTLWGMDIPAEVSGYSYFGNSFAPYGGVLIEQSKLKISNLNKSKTYTFCFFASRGGVSDNRETDYIVEGNDSATVSLNTSSNVNPPNTVCAENMQPNEDGEIFITIKAGKNNNNSSGFYYLGIMKLSKGS